MLLDLNARTLNRWHGANGAVEIQARNKDSRSASLDPLSLGLAGFFQARDPHFRITRI